MPHLFSFVRRHAAQVQLTSEFFYTFRSTLFAKYEPFLGNLAKVGSFILAQFTYEKRYRGIWRKMGRVAF